MKKLTLSFVTLAAVLMFSGLAFAWPSCSGNWISVPAGTSNANGAVVTENGQTFQCQAKTTPPTGSNTNANTNQNTNTSNSSATGGSSKSSATGGSVNNSGNSSVRNNVNSSSSVKNSGNSSNKNTNTATGGQGGIGVGQGGNAYQGQQQSATAANNGNNSNNYSTTTNIKEAAIPVATAFAPTSIPTVPCFKGMSGGVQTMAAGISLGGGKVDEGCDAREFARSYFLVGSKLAGCKILVAQKRSKKAGITLEDCMAETSQPAPVPVAASEPLPIVVTPVVVSAPSAPPITVVVSPPVAVTPEPLGDTTKKVKKHAPKVIYEK